MASQETTRVTMASRLVGVEQGDKTRRLVASDLEKRVGAGARVRLHKCPQDGTNAHPSHRTMRERHCCSITSCKKCRNAQEREKYRKRKRSPTEEEKKIDPSEAVAYHGA